MQTFIEWLQEAIIRGHGGRKFIVSRIQDPQAEERKLQGLQYLKAAQNQIAHSQAPNVGATRELLRQALESFGTESQVGRTIAPLLNMMEKERQTVGPSPNIATYQQGLQIALNQAMGEYKDVDISRKGYYS